MSTTTYRAGKVAIINFTGFRKNWGCQATSWGLISLLNGGLELEKLPKLSLIPLLPRHEVDWQFGQERIQDIHAAMLDVSHCERTAGKALDYLERLVLERYGKYASQTQNADLVIFQAEGTMAGTDFVRGARLLLLPFVAKHAWKKPVLSLNQTIYSCDETFNPVMAAAFNSFDLVAVRENISFDAAQKAGLREVSHIPDAAFLTRPRSTSLNIQAGRHFAVTGTAWTGHDTHEEIFAAADLLKRETGLMPLVTVSTPADKALFELAQRYWGNDGFTYIPSSVSYTAAAYALQQCRFILSGRYHMTIMALAAGTPAIQLPGNSYKNEGLSAMLGGIAPVRAFDDRSAIAEDASRILGDPSTANAVLRNALQPIKERLHCATGYFADVQKGLPATLPHSLHIPPGRKISATDHIAPYCANTIKQVEDFIYTKSTNGDLGKEPTPRVLFEELVSAYHAGDHAVLPSLIQMMGSFPGKIERARPALRDEINRFPLEIFAKAGAPRPADPEHPIMGLQDLHRICGGDIAAMKLRIVPGISPAVPRPTKAKDISSHLATLREEFSTKSELLFYHAALICLMRRGIESTQAYECFQAIWSEENDFLRRELDSRWLVSACDTFADHAQDPADRALAMIGVTLVNTVKLYETENWAIGIRGRTHDYRAVMSQNQLFDGVFAFGIGGGDMMYYMQKRLSTIAGKEHIVSVILSELFSRIHAHDTVFRRLRNMHHVKNTLWDTQL
ncbi:polysaccharide pyruvyl transferase family protein [Paracoccus saliphilus]|uniref:Polysaccharide pyruvyl transferase family protein n=1 Tax=Paracoccus saliphilus TaxID=405559 RepID=A0AA45W5W6_9RHOB|nr:polysaccharide pyruvyl transferase family protein [Paracoccus saliphilus]WCR05479.1 polysaccharide pyruvyl transferase family protein [Paracoccus saliphilus]SIS97210.1 Polysaccharide pyruvyl transferase family protein WcaK [Paracoccus saliphilus]